MAARQRRARGPAGDLDVAVLFGQSPRSWFDVFGLANRLYDAAGGLPLDLDLRPLNDAGPRFQYRVHREGVLLFERSRAERVEFEAAATSRWLDFRPAWERERRRWLLQVASDG